MAEVMPDVGKKLQDWTAAANAIDVGSSLVSLYHQLAIFSPPGKAVSAQETANAIWRGRGFQLNADVYMHRQALLASLPMTLSEAFHKDLAKMRRVSRKTMANAIHLAPLIAEWRGTRTPALVFGGRRGQLMTLDIFDNDLGNYNFAIIGAPGSGKSVLMNEMAWSYRAIDAKVWMEAAFNCSDWVFLLRQKPESIEMLDRKGRLSMDEPKKRLLNSLRTEPGVFSEVYISSPVGEGVARNILDPATHLLFSNKLEDNAPIDELRAQGLSIDDAITELLRRRGHAV